eukprot:TRINITY_DN41615_c1_g1_i1.p2 TRINITY_DN41615_c1_g1~~TRINITY_DN41615_c1_g1_i1.p2  ORF type:complete len:300 (+),score=23.06 TRINITY_DN41615_c1_g1_i1:100-999(+)
MRQFFFIVELYSLMLFRMPLKEGEGELMKIFSMNLSERNKFINLLLRFGVRPTNQQFGPNRFDWRYMKTAFPNKSYEVIQAYGQKLLDWVQYITDKRLDQVPEGIPVRHFLMNHQPKEVLERIGLFSVVMNTLERYQSQQSTEIRLYPEGTKVSKKETTLWTHEHDYKLLQGVYKHGYSRWRDILNDEQLGLKDVIRNEIGLPLDFDVAVQGQSFEELKGKKGQETDWLKTRVHDLVRILQHQMVTASSGKRSTSGQTQKAWTKDQISLQQQNIKLQGQRSQTFQPQGGTLVQPPMFLY